jgi:hypothetical protein
MTPTSGLFDDSAFTWPTDGQSFQFPIVVVGGSTAAYAAALGALQTGAQVCLVQPQKVLGGQFTAQALSAPDDAPLMAPLDCLPPEKRDPQRLGNAEFFCLSRSQRQFRERQRELQPVAGQVIRNPGGSWVSHFSVTPVTAAIALNETITPYLNSRQLTLIPLSEPIEVLIAAHNGNYRRVTGVVFRQHQGQQFTVQGEVMIEATDLGDLLELGHIESRVGQESRDQTGEAILPEIPQPLCQQAFTFCAVVENAAQGQSIPAPVGYGQYPWLDPTSFPCTFWVKGTEQWRGIDFFHPDGMFRYRRLLRSVADSEVHVGDVSVMNWGTSPLYAEGPQGCGNDYCFGAALTGVSQEERQCYLQRGRERTQAYLHQLQTTVAPNLVPRGDLTWTADGIALEPYIREARRGIALTTIRHEDVAAKFFPDAARARCFGDTVGIGQYHYLDFHPNEAPGHVELTAADRASLPFTIPLGALIPIQTDGLILSAKSIGTTHITNSAYRMHPIEWAIGEASGHLAAFALQQAVAVRDVAQIPSLQRRFQEQLTHYGIPIFWFNDVSHDDPDFTAIHVLAAVGILQSETPPSLHFNPQGTVSRSVVAMAFMQVLGLEPITPPQPTFTDVSATHWAYASIEALAAQGIVKGVGHGKFAPEHVMVSDHMAQLLAKAKITSERLSELASNQQPLPRRVLAQVLYPILMQRTT